MDKHTLGHAGSGMLDNLQTDWLDYKVTDLRPVDISALLAKAEQAALRAQAAQPACQGGSAGAVPIAAPAAAQSPTLAWPPGRAGRLAQFIHDSSYSPVREVAITATLGLLAGVCGRAYRTHTGKDLALYMILVARSGIGKDGIHEVFRS